MPTIVTVDDKNSDVPCPSCREKTTKIDFPFDPWPREAKTGQEMRRFIGHAYCESCDDLVAWAVESVLMNRSERETALQVDAVPHGFHWSFRDCAAECADAPREVRELTLTHVIGGRC